MVVNEETVELTGNEMLVKQNIFHNTVKVKTSVVFERDTLGTFS